MQADSLSAASEALAEERDRWLFQLFSGRRYEDLEKFGARAYHADAAGRQQRTGLHAQGKTSNDAALPLPTLKIGARWGWQFPARTW